MIHSSRSGPRPGKRTSRSLAQRPSTLSDQESDESKDRIAKQIWVFTVMEHVTGPTKTVVVLVHGTFAQGAAWTRPGSRLYRRVVSRLPRPRHVEAFRWGTWNNSHVARASAGQKLANRLRKLRATYPAARLIVIAHSHGGNVALYALRAQPERLVDAIVCLATPYIVPKPRSIALYSRLAKLNAGMLLLMCVSFTASFVAAQFGYPLSVVMPWVRPLGLAWPYKALLLLVGIVFSFAVSPRTCLDRRVHN